MGILSDWQIERDIKITPFELYNKEKQTGKVSWGCGSYGYDARVGYKFRVFKPYPCTVIDPKNFDTRMLEEVDLTPTNHEDGVQSKFTTIPDHILIPPHSFVLAETIETFTIPRDVLCVVVGKSTYARCGLVCNVTPGEPEWTGKWTIELSNTTPIPIKVYCGEGIMQCLFFRADGRDERTQSILNLVLSGGYDNHELYNMLHEDVTCRTSYADKKGKYQNQDGITNPSVTKKENK